MEKWRVRSGTSPVALNKPPFFSIPVSAEGNEYSVDSTECFEIPAKESIDKTLKRTELREKLLSRNSIEILFIQCGHDEGGWTTSYQEFWLLLDGRYLCFLECTETLDHFHNAIILQYVDKVRNIFISQWDGAGWDFCTPVLWLTANYSYISLITPKPNLGSSDEYVDFNVDTVLDKLLFDYRFPNLIPTADQVLGLTQMRNSEIFNNLNNPTTSDRTVGFAHLPGWSATQYGGWFLYIPVNAAVMQLPSASLLADGCIVIRSRTPIADEANYFPGFNVNKHIVMVMPIELTEYQNPPDVNYNRYITHGRQLQSLLDRVNPTRGGYDQLYACGSLDEPTAPAMGTKSGNRSGINPLDFMFGGASQQAMAARNAEIRRWRNTVNQYTSAAGLGRYYSPVDNYMDL